MKNDYGFTVENVHGIVEEFTEFNSKESWCDSIEFTMTNLGKKYAVRVRLVSDEEEYR